MAVVVFAVLAVIGVAVMWDWFDEATTVGGRGDGVDVTLAEFDAVQVGMTLAEVERIIGGEGSMMSAAGEGATRSEMWSWDGRGTLGANVIISFSDGKVIAKTQVGLR